MASITLFFFAHQPDRLRSHRPGRTHQQVSPSHIHGHFFDEGLNRQIFEKVAKNCYYPATRLILEMINERRGSETPFRVSFGLSGVLFDQAERYDRGLIDLFRELAATGHAEFTGETYFHSLAGLFGGERAEFKEQVRMHSERLRTLLGVTPTAFRNTECLYNDEVADAVQGLGFEGVLTEGVDWLLADRGRSSDLVYCAPCGLPVMVRNFRLSDDVGYRFSDRGWDAWPLKADTFAQWLSANNDANILLAIDYEAIGEHMWAESGIFEFLRHLPGEVSRYPQLSFTTPTAVFRSVKPSATVSVEESRTISWADAEKNTSAWLGNRMQVACFEELVALEKPVKKSGSRELLDAWRRMLTSDHLYYMASKSPVDQQVHNYFSAYGTPEEAFVRYYGAISELACRIAA